MASWAALARKRFDLRVCVCVWETGADGERAVSNEARGNHADDVVPAKLVMKELNYFSVVSCRMRLLGCQPLRN